MLLTLAKILKSTSQLKKKTYFTALHYCTIMQNPEEYPPPSYAPIKPANLSEIVEALNEFAPLHLAESWDNVGLLIEPSSPRNPINNIFLTNDLTEAVMKEAIDKKADLIISYHPPIFAPLKRITQGNWKERIVSSCLENKIALYSPHTAWDATANGINDWLLRPFNPVKNSIRAITPNQIDTPTIGAGRFCTLTNRITLHTAIELIKTHLNLKHVQITIGCNQSLHSAVSSIAVCAGSGASLLKNIAPDLFITGEMSHHELLDAAHRNISVIVCNHSNTERGYFSVFQYFFDPSGDAPFDFFISKQDADPLILH